MSTVRQEATPAIPTQEAITGMVVPTTHWDRAWYWPFERFRVRLIEAFHAVEQLWDADPDYIFTMDGQSIAVEDYLEVLPKRGELLRAMGRAGRFRMGPLYVLNDVWLTGAEAMVRNLLIGRELAERYEALQECVYQPDTFGFYPELPSLLAGCGVDTFLAMRGAPTEKIGRQRFFWWEAPDGSRVQVYRLRDGYANAAGLGRHVGTGEIMDAKSTGIHPGFSMEVAITKLGRSCDLLRDGHGAPHLLLAGVDHQIPQRELPDILAATTNEQTSFRYATLDDVADVMRVHEHRAQWYVHRGELHNDSAHQLGGTISSRITLKQNNAAVEQILVRSIEPGAVAISALGIYEPAVAVLQHAWKQVLRVHPHDNITGCSVDAVHSEDEHHLSRAMQAADALERRLVWHLCQRYGTQEPGDERNGFVLYSTDLCTGPQRVQVVLDCEGRSNWGDFVVGEFYRVVDEDGQAVPFRQLRRGPAVIHPHQQLELELSVALTPFQLRRFFIESCPAERVGCTALSNEHLHVDVDAQGIATITERASGQRWRGCGRLWQQADVGDEYTFSPQPGAVEVELHPQLMRDSHHGQAGMQALRHSGSVRVPAWSAADGSRGPLVEVPLSVTWSLAPGDKQVQVDIALDNRVHDLRLRWGWDLSALPEQVRVGHKLADQERPVAQPFQRKNGSWSLPIHPADHHLTVAEGDRHLAVLSPHPFEYEVLAQASGARVAVTLLRAVGMLSVSKQVVTRGPGAGPNIPTPEAQCQGTHHYRFALRPLGDPAAALPVAMDWRARPLRGMIWGADPQHAHDDTSLMKKGELVAESGALRLHALKPAADGHGAVLRLANPCADDGTACLRGPLLAHGVVPCDHLERPLTGAVVLPDAEGRLLLTVPAWGLRSFRIPPPPTSPGS